MEIARTEYKIVKLTPVGFRPNINRHKFPIRIVLTDFFSAGDKVTVLDLKKLERTTEIKIVKTATGTAIINSLFSNHVNKFAVVQEVRYNQIDLLVTDAGDNEGKYNLNNFVIYTNDKAVLMTVLDDSLIQSFQRTTQQQLFF